METRIPVSLQPLINAYLSALEPLHTHFYVIYIHGSLALDAFEEQASDTKNRELSHQWQHHSG
jgi:hypothetical protein